MTILDQRMSCSLVHAINLNLVFLSQTDPNSAIQFEYSSS